MLDKRSPGLSLFLVAFFLPDNCHGSDSIALPGGTATDDKTSRAVPAVPTHTSYPSASLNAHLSSTNPFDTNATENTITISNPSADIGISNTISEGIKIDAVKTIDSSDTMDSLDHGNPFAIETQTIKLLGTSEDVSTGSDSVSVTPKQNDDVRRNFENEVQDVESFHEEHAVVTVTKQVVHASLSYPETIKINERDSILMDEPDNSNVKKELDDDTKIETGEQIIAETSEEIQIKTSEEINIKTSEEINIETGEGINVEAGEHIIAKTSEEVNIETSKEINIETGEEIEVQTSGFKMFRKHKNRVSRKKISADTRPKITPDTYSDNNSVGNAGDTESTKSTVSALATGVTSTGLASAGVLVSTDGTQMYRTTENGSLSSINVIEGKTKGKHLL